MENSRGMDSCVGSIVLSTAGRDRKRYFMIVGVDDNAGFATVYIADGKLHKLSAPKKKKLRHLRVLIPARETDAALLSESALTDKKLKAYIDEHTQGE